MSYLFGNLLLLIVGREKAIAILRGRGDPGSAWEIESAYGLRRLRADPTFAYTFDCAEHDVFRAELAVEAGAYEWAFINATDALAILEWKGEREDPLRARAATLAAQSAEKIAPERLEELTAMQEQAMRKHNTLSELRFKQRLARDHYWLWARAARAERPKINARP